MRIIKEAIKNDSYSNWVINGNELILKTSEYDASVYVDRKISGEIRIYIKKNGKAWYSEEFPWPNDKNLVAALSKIPGEKPPSSNLLSVWNRITY